MERDYAVRRLRAVGLPSFARQTTACDTLVCRALRGRTSHKTIKYRFWRSDVHRVRVGRAERAQAIGDDTRMDGREPAEPQRGSWREDAPIRSLEKNKNRTTRVRYGA
jgi:hypothetical protein